MVRCRVLHRSLKLCWATLNEVARGAPALPQRSWGSGWQMEQQDGSCTATAFRTLFSQQPEKLGDSPLPPQTHCPTPPAPPFLNQHKFLHPFTPHFALVCPRPFAETFGDAEGTALDRMQLESRPWDAPWRLMVSLLRHRVLGPGLSVLGNYLSFSAAFVHRSVSSHHPPPLLPSLIREHGATASRLQAQLLPACVLEVGVIHAQPGAAAAPIEHPCT
uniref:Sdr protein n=1 Tax=Gallus gallus TaxID=9031 RepID=Q91344_CHICK|nr:src downstream region [Gallus gallus]